MPNRRYATECKGCGGEVISNMRYCPWCGTKIDRSVFYGKVQGIPKPKESQSLATEKKEVKVMKKIYFDGSPKGWVCISLAGKHQVEKNSSILGKIGLPTDHIGTTMSQRAEYLGLIFALQHINSYESHLLIGDCENVILQMQGVNKCKDPYLQELKKIVDSQIATKGLQVWFKHVLRDENPAGIFLENYLKRR